MRLCVKIKLVRDILCFSLLFLFLLVFIGRHLHILFLRFLFLSLFGLFLVFRFLGLFLFLGLFRLFLVFSLLGLFLRLHSLYVFLFIVLRFGIIFLSGNFNNEEISISVNKMESLAESFAGTSRYNDIVEKIAVIKSMTAQFGRNASKSNLLEFVAFSKSISPYFLDTKQGYKRYPIHHNHRKHRALFPSQSWL